MSRSYSMLLPGLLLPLSAFVCHEAEAASAGAVRGTITDDGGLPVPGALVTLTGPDIAGALQVESDADGNFRFVSVPVGVHQLEIVKSGLSPAKLRITVRLDETAFAPVILRVSGMQEVVVEEIVPVIDSTSSSFNTELNAASLDNMPTARSFSSAVNILPGVYGRVNTMEGGSGDGNPSVRGEGQYGNNYFIDGLSTRDPATHTLGASVTYDAIEDIQVYTDGAPAEFGQSTGMLINAVTKDGGDEHHGSAAYYLRMSASGGSYELLDPDVSAEVPTTKGQFMTHELALTAGGPIVKEKLWYFGALSLSHSRSHEDGQVACDENDGENADWWTGGACTYDSFAGLYNDDDAAEPWNTAISAEGFAKVKWFVTPDVSLAYQFSADYSFTPNILRPYVAYDADAQQNQTDTNWVHSLTANWRPDAKTEIEAKGSWQRASLDVEPASGDGATPQINNIDTGSYYNNADSYDYNIRGNMGATLKLTHLMDGSTGHHKVKVGAEMWEYTDSRELVFTGGAQEDGGVLYYAGTDDYGTYWPCDADDYSDCWGYRASKNVGALAHHDYVFTVFAQDDWQPVKGLTANLGVRLDHEAMYNNADDLVFDQWLPAPRFGVAWDITGDNKTKFTLNAGRYYDIGGSSLGEWGDTRSAADWSEYRRDADGNYYLAYRQDPVANASIYDDNLRPYHMDKLALGLEREVIPLFALGVRGIVSQTVDLPEDVDVDLDNWFITNPDSKRRDYRAVEITAEKKLHDGWQILASYTLSESLGTMPGQFELATGGQTGSDGNGVGVYLDDVNDEQVRVDYMNSGAGWILDGLHGLGTETDDAGYYGYLPYHSFHQLKVNGSYTFKFGTTLGLVYEFDSGHAWQKRGFVWLYGDYFGFPEGRGSRFMPATHYLDVHLAHEIDLKHGRAVEASVDLFNVADFSTPISYYENDNENFGKVVYRQSPRSMRAQLKFTY